MAKPKKRKTAKKSPEQLHALTTDQLARHVFGAKGHKLLKNEVVTHDKPKNKDWQPDDA